ncbi:hypothetical protein FWH09_02875, partial [Candidatus Saccharibacteria bacterium]|nr:hypothetical protein [Candidatus Saccharibacteria bacterium]
LFPLRMRPVADATFELTPIQTLNSNRLLAKDADEVLYSVDFSGGNNYRVQRLNFTMESLQELIDITVARNGEATEEGGAEEKDEIKLERIVATHNDNNFWVQGSNNTVFLYTANSRRLTLIGVTNRVMMEAEFNYRDLVFVAQNTQNNRYEVFFYQIGDATPTYWRAFDEKPKMAMASYDNVNYLALEFGEQTIIYYSSRGRFFENAERLTTIEDTGNLSFSPSGRFLRVGDKNYDIENDVFYEEISANHWFNGHIMSFMREDKFFVKDFDGQNEREVAIEPVSLDYVFISDNNRRLYYFDVENRLIFVDLQGVE